MKLYNTADPTYKPSILMVVYGEGGVGKTTFSSTAPGVLIADCENGSKYFGLRGIASDVGVIDRWEDLKEFLTIAEDDKYQTIVIDPIGELMDKLMEYMVRKQDSKLVQKDGAPTMAGWGWLKNTMRKVLKSLRDSGKNVIIIAHVVEREDEGRLVKRPMIATKLSEELINLVDIVGYMTTVPDNEGGEPKRVIIVDPASDKFVAKDRTGKLGRIIEPDFTKIIDGIRGDTSYAWIKDDKAAKPKKPDRKPVGAAQARDNLVNAAKALDGKGFNAQERREIILAIAEVDDPKMITGNVSVDVIDTVVAMQAEELRSKYLKAQESDVASDPDENMPPMPDDFLKTDDQMNYYVPDFEKPDSNMIRPDMRKFQKEMYAVLGLDTEKAQANFNQTAIGKNKPANFDDMLLLLDFMVSEANEKAGIE